MVPEAVVNWVVVEVKAGIVTVLVTVVVVGAPTVVVKVDMTVPGCWTKVSEAAPGEGNGFGSVQPDHNNFICQTCRKFAKRFVHTPFDCGESSTTWSSRAGSRSAIDELQDYKRKRHMQL
jgi:hypothetical protein